MEIVFTIISWVGLASLVCWGAFGYDYCRKKYNFSESLEYICAIGLIALLFSAIGVHNFLFTQYRQALLDNEHQVQYNNCLNYTRPDGNSWGEDECMYLQDIFNGTTDYVFEASDEDINDESSGGAICNDGTRSYSTGRGTCSHHGGVNYWL